MCVNGRAGSGSEEGYVRVRMDAHDLNHQNLTRFAINEAALHDCMNRGNLFFPVASFATSLSSKLYHPTVAVIKF